MERQSKESRGLEAHCIGGQGLPRAVAPSGGGGAVYDIMWKYILELVRPQMTIWRMRIACWIHNTKNTQSEYVTRIASPLQQWLHKSPSILAVRILPALFIFLSHLLV